MYFLHSLANSVVHLRRLVGIFAFGRASELHSFISKGAAGRKCWLHQRSTKIKAPLGHEQQNIWGSVLGTQQVKNQAFPEVPRK
jgi:hypothetical protein